MTTPLKLDGQPPFDLPPAHLASAWPTTEGVKITFQMLTPDGDLHPVSTVISLEVALGLAESIGRAAKKFNGQQGWLT